MNIKQALELKRGDKVQYPADRGNPPGVSEITLAGDTTPKSAGRGEQYIWVTLKVGGVWPTNRLSKV